MFENYHTHTKRCQHAVGEDREYVEAAIEAGIAKLGFSDHCPWIYSDNYVSGIRMTPFEVDGYFDSLSALKNEYKNDIEILMGFEAEYLPELVEAQDNFLKNYPVDYMILGQHFLGREADSIYCGAPTTDENLIKTYVDLAIEGMESGRYMYLAHPDLINFVGDTAIYDKYMLKLLQYLKEKNLPVELNVLGASEGRHYPNPHFLSLAKKTGNTSIIGIDAHSPAQLKNKANYEICVNLQKKYSL